MESSHTEETFQEWTEHVDDETTPYYESSNGAVIWERPPSLDIIPEQLDNAALRELIHSMELDATECHDINSLVQLGHYAKQLLSSSEQVNALISQQAYGPWQVKHDDESGHPYYENNETGEVVWEKPASIEEYERNAHSHQESTGIEESQDIVEPSWEDNNNDQHYTENNENTQENEWQEHYDDESGHVYYQNIHTQEIVWEKPESYQQVGNDEYQEEEVGHDHELNEEYEERYDVEEERNFYIHKETGETTWERPSALKIEINEEQVDNETPKSPQYPHPSIQLNVNIHEPIVMGASCASPTGSLSSPSVKLPPLEKRHLPLDFPAAAFPNREFETPAQ